MPNTDLALLTKTSPGHLGQACAVVVACLALVCAPACVSNPTPHPGNGDGTSAAGGGTGTGGQSDPAGDGATAGGEGAGTGAGGAGGADAGPAPADTGADSSAGADTQEEPDGLDDAGDDDAGPTDFTGTACEVDWTDGSDERCVGNVGCTELAVECGDCACTLCADEACVRVTCDDGGSDECPGGWSDDADADADAGTDAADGSESDASGPDGGASP